MKIFIVDDDADFSQSRGIFLRLDGHEVELAFDGETAVEQFRHNDYDITFMDVRLPGLAVSGGMPQHNHGLPTSPAVTAAFEDGDYKVEGMRFHMRGYWEIRVSIDTGTKRDIVTIALTL